MIRDRDKWLTIRASEAEVEMVKQLATDAGVTVSDWIRLTIRKFFAERPTNKDLPNG